MILLFLYKKYDGYGWKPVWNIGSGRPDQLLSLKVDGLNLDGPENSWVRSPDWWVNFTGLDGLWRRLTWSLSLFYISLGKPGYLIS